MAPIRTLLVDDDDDVRLLLQVMLEASGRFVVEGSAASSVDAVRLAQNDAFDLVVLDYDLPDTDASVTMPVLRRLNPDACIVLCTAWDNVGARAVGARCDGVIQKGRMRGVARRLIELAERRP